MYFRIGQVKSWRLFAGVIECRSHSILLQLFERVHKFPLLLLPQERPNEMNVELGLTLNIQVVQWGYLESALCPPVQGIAKGSPLPITIVENALQCLPYQ